MAESKATADWQAAILPPVGSHYVERRPVEGVLVALMNGQLQRRGFVLKGYPTRALRAGDLHELIVTDELPEGDGSRVDHIGYLGFVEITQGGIVVRGDRLLVGTRAVGLLAGFDECHMPNHLNVIVHHADCRGGQSRGLALGDRVCFEPPTQQFWITDSRPRISRG